MLNYYNEETISEAKALLHNKIAPEKKFMKRKGVGMARETLKDIHDMLVELDADPRGGARHFHLGGALEGPVLQQWELSMVCVRLS